MERLILRAVLGGALLVPVSLLGAPRWAVIVAIIPALAIAQFVLPDGPERDLPLRDRLPSPGRAVLMLVVVSAAGAMGAAGLMNSWPGVLVWAGVLGVLVVAGRVILRHREQPRAA